MKPLQPLRRLHSLHPSAGRSRKQKVELDQAAITEVLQINGRDFSYRWVVLG